MRVAIAILGFVWASGAYAGCHGVNAQATAPLTPPSATSGCHTRLSHGYPIPDPACTPGAINPTVTVQVLQAPDYRTTCTRNNLSSAAQKAKTYAAYSIPHPVHNVGQDQTCELDHLVSLELGGSDGIENIWPQCGPSNVPVGQRYFKIKDGVEDYLAAQVRAGRMALSEAQHGIASDWTQYIAAAKH